MKASFKKTLRKTVLTMAFFTAVFVTPGLAQQSSTADKPTGATPGATTDTVKTAPTYKSLDSLTQETKTKGAHPWSNDPDYIARLEEIEFEHTYLMETAQSDYETAKEKRKAQLDERLASLNADKERAALECGEDAFDFNLGDIIGNASDCAQEINRINARIKEARLYYKADTIVIGKTKEKAVMNADHKKGQNIRDLDKEFSKKPEYKGQSELRSFEPQVFLVPRFRA